MQETGRTITITKSGHYCQTKTTLMYIDKQTDTSMDRLIFATEKDSDRQEHTYLYTLYFVSVGTATSISTTRSLQTSTAYLAPSSLAEETWKECIPLYLFCMYMYVSVCTCTNVCTHVHVQHVCTFMYICTCMCVYMYVCVHVYMYLYVQYMYVYL